MHIQLQDFIIYPSDYFLSTYGQGKNFTAKTENPKKRQLIDLM
jgi:hypothetical protein